jgi:hypothetical protein
MKKNKLIFWIIISVLWLQVSTNNLYAFPSSPDIENEEAGHAGLTKMSIDVKRNLPESETNGLENVMGGKNPVAIKAFKDFLSSANVSEDNLFGSGLSGARHFYDPTTGLGWLGIFQNAKDRANDFYKSGIKKYCDKKDKMAAWEKLGHALHLLQDMAVPAHTNNATHISPADSFEKYVADNWDIWHKDTPNEGKIIKGYDNNSNPIYYTGLKDFLQDYMKEIPYNKSVYQLNDPSEYVNTLATRSHNLPVDKRSRDLINNLEKEISWEEKSKNAEILLPLALMYSAGLINTFWADVTGEKAEGIAQMCFMLCNFSIPGNDHPDDSFDVSDEFYWEENFNIAIDKLAELYMRSAIKKGKIGVWYYSQIMEEFKRYMSTVTDEERSIAGQRLNTLGKIIIPNSEKFRSDWEGAPDIALFTHGFYNPSISLMLKMKEPVAFKGLDFDPSIVKDHPVMIIPSGGLFGLENSEILKASLEEYVKNGGTLIVFAQQHGYEFSVIPVPQEEDETFKEVTGYGWTEDQSCQSNSSYIDTYHQILSGQNRSTPSLNIDGYFNDYPSNATVLLRRTINGQPAMIMYDYGQGKVIVTSMYSDWAYGHSQASKDEIALVRDIISWAKKPTILPEIKPGETLSVNVSLTNNSTTDAASVKLLIYDPDRKDLLKEETISTFISPGSSTQLLIQCATPTTASLGIYHIDYELYDAQGNVIQPQAETDSGRFVVSNPPTNPYKSPDFNFSVNSDSEYYMYGSDAVFTVTIWNNSDTDKTVTAKYCMPHHYLETGDPQYGGWAGRLDLWLTKTLLVPANGSSSFTHAMNNARASSDRFWAYFYDGDNKNIGLATKGFFVVKPSVEVGIQTDKTLYAKGETVSLTVNLQNKQSISYATTLKVKVIDPSNTSVYSNSPSVTLPADGTSTQSLGFTLPPTAQNGLFIVSAEAYDGSGKKIGGNSATFEVPSAMLSINPTLPSTFTPNASFQASFEVKNIWVIDVPTATLKVDFVSPTGNTLFTNTEEFSITSGQTKTLIYSVPTGPVVFGNYHLKYLLTYGEKVASGEKVVPRSYIIQNTFDKVTYSVGDTISATVNISNSGKFQEDLPLKVEIPEFSYSSTSSVSTSPQQTVTQPFSIPVPGNAISGKHTLIVTIGTASITKTFDFYVPESKLELSAPSGTYSANDNIPVTVNNIGGGGTNYELNATLTDIKGIAVSNQILTGTISAKETKAHNVSIPSGTLSGQYILKLTIKDTATNKIASLNTTLSVTGISGTLSIRTEKDVYLYTEGIKAITDIVSTGMSIPDAELNIKVIPAMKTSTVRGTVINAATTAPIQGAKISIGDKETYTTSQGEYSLINVSPGLQTINITYPGFDRATANINVMEGSQTYDAALSTSKYGTLKGTIADSMTGELIIGAKIEITPKEILSSDAESRVSYSNFDGISEIKLPIGTYTLQITKESYQSFGTEILITEGLNESQFPLTKINIQPLTTGELTGKVIDKVTGEILLGVEVKLDSAFSNRTQMNEQTYHFSDISPGSHTLSVNYAGYDRFETTVDIIAGQQSYDIPLAPSLYGNLTGTVKNESTGNVIVDARIELSSVQVASADQSSMILYSDFTGSYTLNKIPVGTYAAKVTRQYYSDLDTTVTIQEGTSTFDISLQQVEQIPDINETEPNNSLAQGTPLNIDENGSGTIDSSGDKDYYKVTVPSNGTLKATLSDIPSGHTYQLYLYDSAGSTLASIYSAPSPGPATLSKFVDQGGDYYVFVQDFYGSTSTLPYKIRVEFVPLDGNIYVDEPNDTIATATILSLDKTEDGYIYYGGDLDYYKVTVSSNGTIKATLSDIPSGHTYQLYLYDSAGSTLASIYSAPSPGPATLSKFVDQGGDYYVFVQDFYGSTSTLPYKVYTIFSPQDLPAEKVIFDKTTSPVNLIDSQTINDDIPAIGMTGKFLVTGTLKSSTSQVISKTEYPFYTIKGNTVLLFNTDKKLYKPGDAVIITGEVQNLAATTASGVSLVLSQLSATGIQDIYSATFDIPANESYPFTVTAIASTDGTYTVTGKVTQGNSILAEISDHYEVASPNVTVTVSAPEIAGNEPININLELKNEGLITAVISLQSSIDSQTQTITIPAGETRLIQYSQQIPNDTTYTFSFTGDLTKTITKTVTYGLGASIADNPLAVYPEGRIEIPVTIVNTGQLDENLTVTYSLQPSALVQSKTYYIARSATITDTLYFDLLEGNYQLSTTTQQPVASNQASFSIRKENKVEMSISSGAQTNDLILLTVNLTNLGYNEVSGSMNLNVYSSGSGQIVWSGSQTVNQLSSQNSQPFTFNINPSTIQPGNYSIKAEFFNSSGQQLGIISSSLTIYGPIFQITQLPPYQTFTAGGEAVFTFKVKNTGNKEGAFDFNLKIYDLIDSTKKEWLQPNEEKPITFSSMLPIDLEEKDYYGDYELKGQGSDTKGQVRYHLEGISLSVDANLDKQYYHEGETVHLTLNIQSQRHNSPSLFARVNYNGYEDQRLFTLNGAEILTFDIPLTEITGEKLFYGIYYESGRSIYLNSLYIYKAGDVLTITTDKQVYNPGETVSMTISGTSGTLILSATNYSETFAFTETATKSFTLPTMMTAGTYNISYELSASNGETYTGNHSFDVAGISVKVKEATLDKGKYAASDTLNMGLIIESNQNLSATLKAWVVDAEGKYTGAGENSVDLSSTEPLVFTNNYSLSTSASGIHRLVYGIYAGDLLLVSGSEAFDVGNAVLTGISTDKTDYSTNTEVVNATVSTYGTVDATLELQFDGITIKTQIVSLSGFSSFNIEVGIAEPGTHTLKAILTAGYLQSTKETTFTYALSLLDSDKDCMPDEWEIAHGLDPNNPADASLDPDNDGLTNLQEYQRSTNPNNPDTDNDGIPDGWEVTYGLNPNVNDALSDEDNDGFNNLQEYLGGSNPTDPASMPNQPPVANAGPGQNVNTGKLITLDGSGSHDPEGALITFLWSFIEVPIGSNITDTLLSDTTSAKPNFTPDIDGTYKLELIVNDGVLNSAPDEVLIVAATTNVAPNANAGPDQNALTGGTVYLNGSISNDPDNRPWPLFYLWSVDSIPSGSFLTNNNIINRNKVSASFIPDVNGSYILSLTVSDGELSSVDTVNIDAATQNVPPNANAGPDITIYLGQTATLDGSESNDPDNGPSPLRYSCSFVALPNGSQLRNEDIIGIKTISPYFTPDVSGTYVLELMVDDGQNYAFDNVAVTALKEATICSILGNDPKPSILDQDIFKFIGNKGETVTISLESNPAGAGSGKRATLMLAAKIPKILSTKIDRSVLPNEIKVTLPATGEYFITVAEQPKIAKGKKYTGAYCLSLEASPETMKTLKPAFWVE